MSMYLLQKSVINGMDKVKKKASSGKGVLSRHKIPFSEMDNSLC